MLKSMTAYGRACTKSRLGHFVCEIQSVNRKFLDVQVAISKELSQFEIEVKKWVLSHLFRGQVTVKINATFDSVTPLTVKPNLLFAKQLKEAAVKLAEELDLSEAEVSLSLLSNANGLLKVEENLEDEEAFREALKEIVDASLKQFIENRIAEGAALQNDINGRIENMRLLIKQIEVKAPGATLKYRDKLLARLNELLENNIENEERVLREIALFAEKIDIAEELTRFSYHIDHLQELIHSTIDGVGKTLEFVLQELNREINTIGSKSSDIEISRLVIDIKSELERIREQIQNVE